MTMMVYTKERFMNGWKSLGAILERAKQRNRSRLNVVHTNGFYDRGLSMSSTVKEVRTLLVRDAREIKTRLPSQSMLQEVRAIFVFRTYPQSNSIFWSKDRVATKLCLT
jgi:hypothetical protein